MEKKPFLTEAMAQQIIEDVPTPFHVYDEKGIRENARPPERQPLPGTPAIKEYLRREGHPQPPSS